MSSRIDHQTATQESAGRHSGAELRYADWKKPIELRKPFGTKMKHSDATAHPLVKCGAFGADLIRFDGGGKVGPHTHPGDHILICMEGRGLLWFDGSELELSPGVIYMVPGEVPHAVYAHPQSETALVLFAIGNDHQPANSYNRLDITNHAYEPSWKMPGAAN